MSLLDRLLTTAIVTASTYRASEIHTAFEVQAKHIHAEGRGMAYPGPSAAAQEVHSMHISFLHGNLVNIAGLLVLHLPQQISTTNYSLCA